MKKLKPDWLTEGLMDFEYKKYILLAYLQHVNTNFSEKKLYPFLNDLIFHYNNLLTIKNKKEIATSNFPSKITKVDLENFRFEFEKLIQDDECIDVLVSILDYAIPKLKLHLTAGKDLYEFVEEHMTIFPVGVIPLNKEDGYIFIKENDKRDTQVFEYKITIFESAADNFRGIKTDYVATYQTSISNTFEKIKMDLIEQNRSMPNPATYLIESRHSFPFEETLLPVAKRRFVRYIANAE